MLNKEKFAKEIIEIACNGSSIAMDINTHKLAYCESIECQKCSFYNFNGYPCEEKMKEWANSEYKENILTEKEKTYLENVIRPFKDNIEFVTKVEVPQTDKNGIIIVLSDTGITLPFFEKNKYYKGMETEKRYNLEELGLFESEGK